MRKYTASVDLVLKVESKNALTFYRYSYDLLQSCYVARAFTLALSKNFLSTDIRNKKRIAD